jgi:ABC-2 type transport system ATP-binding protein
MNFNQADELTINVLSLSNVSKRYDSHYVLDGVNLTLKKGSVMGLLGANGSGKTTLLKTALGLLKADKGQVELFAEDAWDLSENNKQKIGYVAQSLDFFHWMKVQQLLDYTSGFYPNWDHAKANQLINDWNIGKDKKVSILSEGQKQRLAITLAMSHSPELLILDEPVASLDPVARRQFIKQLIDMNIDNQTSILFSTHITSDIERVAADVAFLKDGKIQYQGGVDDLKERVVRLHVLNAESIAWDNVIPSILSKKVSSNSTTLTVNNFDSSLLPEWEKQCNAKIQVELLNLEDVFLELNQ